MYELKTPPRYGSAEETQKAKVATMNCHRIEFLDYSHYPIHIAHPGVTYATTLLRRAS
jgi:hypothetical protein